MPDPANGATDPAAEASSVPSATPTASPTPTMPSEEEISEIAEDYRAYVAGQVDDLIAATEDLSAAIKRGSPVQARARYPESRRTWNAVRVFAKKVDGLVDKVDATWHPPADLAAAEKEWRKQSEAAMWAPNTPAAEGAGDGGWGRIEWSIFADRTIKHLSPVGDDLLDNLEQLRTLMPDLEITLSGMAAEALELQDIAEDNAAGSTERYSGADLAALAGNAATIRAVVELLEPVAEVREPGLGGEIRDQLDELDRALRDLEVEDGQGYVKYGSDLDSDQRSAVADAADAVRALAEPLERLEDAVR